MIEKALPEHIEQVNLVAAEYLKGKSPGQISTELDLPPARVNGYIKEWKGMAVNSDAVRSRAREALAGADLHYNGLIGESYKLIDDANAAIENGDISTNQGLSHRAHALKMVADLEAKRMAMLQQAGLLENQELADQLLEQERQQEAIMGIITDVVGECKTCKPRVLQRMAGLGKEAGDTFEVFIE